MKKRNVYIVWAECGEYDDFRERLVACYDDLPSAERHVALAQQANDRRYERGRLWWRNEYDSEDADQPTPKWMDNEGTKWDRKRDGQTTYSVVAVPVTPKFGG